MSLREKVESAKAARSARAEEEARAGAEAEQNETAAQAARGEEEQRAAAEAQEGERAELKKQLDGLVEKRAALASLKQRYLDTTTEVQSARTALKGERGQLRQLHEESIDPKTGEAEVPTPRELIGGKNRTSEFQDEEEVQSYNKAAESFRGASKSAKDVQAELAALDIEDPANLKPGQLEKILEEKDAELNNETRTFVLEHPDVDPERTAQIKEELIQSRKGELDKHLEQSSPEARLTFYNSLQRGQQDGNWHDGTFKTRTLGNAVESSSRSIFNSADQENYVNVLSRVFRDSNGELTEMDREAVVRALAEDIVRDKRLVLGPQRDASITDALNRENYMQSRRDGEEYTPLQNVDRLHRDVEDPDERFKLQKGEAQERTQRVIEAVAATPELQAAADKLIDGYKRSAEYKKIPDEIRTLEERQRAIQNRLGNENGLRGSFDMNGSIAEEERKHAQSERDHGTKKEKLEQREKAIKELPAKLLKLKQLPSETLDAPVSVERHGGQLVVRIEPGWNTGKLGEMTKQDEADQKRVEALQMITGRIDREKDGLLGMSAAKKADIAQLEQLLGGRASGKGAVEAAKQEVATLTKGIEDRKTERRTLEDADDQLRKDLAPLSEATRLLDGEEYSGTLRDYLEQLDEHAKKEAGRAEQRLVDHASEKEELRKKKEGLSAERDELKEEQKQTTERLAALRTRQTELREQLRREGYRDIV